jgi:hypothetical protein
MKRKRSKGVKIAAGILAVLVILILVNFIPTLYLKNHGMSELKGEHITVYYEKEEAAAKDVFVLVESESGRIADKLGFTSPQSIKLYVYDEQGTMQMKKYGLIVLLLNLDWYIGDNRSTNVLLTSPANPGNAHGYDDVKNASVHEMVHAYNSLLNAQMPCGSMKAWQHICRVRNRAMIYTIRSIMFRALNRYAPTIR